MSSSRNIAYLFVYGTLRNEINHPITDVLEKYTLEVKAGTVQGKLFDAGSFPAAIASDDPSDVIHGKLYKIKDPKSVFRHLDPYEGYSPGHPSQSLFIRKKVLVKASAKQSTTAWIYLYNKPVDRLARIPDGDFLTFLKEKQPRSN